MKSRRVGRFMIERDLIDNRQGEIVELFHDLKILVVRAEMRYENDAVEYVGFSPNFKEIEPGWEVPHYSIKAETDPEHPGKYKYTIT